MNVPALTWPQALAWRLRRHDLEPVGSASVQELVGRLCGVQAQVASSAEFAVRVRQSESNAGDVAGALARGDVLKTWAMRGTLHLLAPADGAAFLSLIAAGRSWERPSWIRYFNTTPDIVERVREGVREALRGRTLTREELIDAVVNQNGLEHVGEQMRSGWGTLLKPVAWQGDLCFGANRGTRVTFRHPSDASPQWRGIPSSHDAAPVAIPAYLAAYGPANAESFASWLAGGWFSKRQVKAMFAELANDLAEVEVDGERLHVRAEDLDELLAARPTAAVRLLGGFDQWVLGPGTSDPRILATQRRTAVSRQSGWIAPIVVVGGVVAGTWELDGENARVDWFQEAGTAPRRALTAEVERVGVLLGRKLTLVVREI